MIGPRTFADEVHARRSALRAQAVRDLEAVVILSEDPDQAA